MEPNESLQKSTKSTQIDLLNTSSALSLKISLKILYQNRIKATGSILSALKTPQMGHSTIKKNHKTLSEDLIQNISCGNKNFFQHLIPSLLIPSLFSIFNIYYILGSTFYSRKLCYNKSLNWHKQQEEETHSQTEYWKFTPVT